MSRSTPDTGLSLPLRLQGYHLLWRWLSIHSSTRFRLITPVLTPASISADRFGLFRFRSPLLTESHFVFSSWGYLDVSVPPVSPPYAMDLRKVDSVFTTAGFPHSDIRASSVICTFTQLFAACHVLHRLLVPGHPPCALSSLTFS